MGRLGLELHPTFCLLCDAHLRWNVLVCYHFVCFVLHSCGVMCWFPTSFSRWPAEVWCARSVVCHYANLDWARLGAVGLDWPLCESGLGCVVGPRESFTELARGRPLAGEVGTPVLQKSRDIYSHTLIKTHTDTHAHTTVPQNPPPPPPSP